MNASLYSMPGSKSWPGCTTSEAAGTATSCRNSTAPTGRDTGMKSFAGLLSMPFPCGQQMSPLLARQQMLLPHVRTTKSTGCKEPIKEAQRQPAMLTVLSAGVIAAVGVSRVNLLADGNHCIICGAIWYVWSVDIAAPIWAHSRHDCLHLGVPPGQATGHTAQLDPGARPGHSCQRLTAEMQAARSSQGAMVRSIAARQAD